MSDGSAEPADDRLSGYDFELPADRIAQTPAPEREDSRLLVLDRRREDLQHRCFRDLVEFLKEGDLLVVNRSRVLPARLYATRQSTGGRIELLFLEREGSDRFRALLRARGRIAPGETLKLAGRDEALRLESVGERGEWSLREAPGFSIEEVMEAEGCMPLPPYIKRGIDQDEARDLDRERYQTVFAREPGAVAAPTAGLHFGPRLLDDLRRRGVGLAEVTLHVGVGTFRPVEVDHLAEHVMHDERFTVGEEAAQRINETRSRGGRVVAVGTTALRALESAHDPLSGRTNALSGRTRIFIRPPDHPRSIDALITNFHLPKSTLLVLVAAMVGRERILSAYRQAVAAGYRFFSYGDAMLIL